jgi:hypothetical protein
LILPAGNLEKAVDIAADQAGKRVPYRTCRRQGILVSFTSPPQPINSPEYAEIPQKHVAWKTLEK